MVMPAKNTICLWYNGDAEEAARFYARTFPDPAVAKRAFDAMMEMTKIDVALYIPTYTYSIAWDMVADRDRRAP